MTSTICSNTPIEPALGSTKQLVDKRDQKKYWVTRLQDGNCWMTQNLDYELYPYGAGTQDVTLSAETSDVPSNFPKITMTGYNNATGVEEWGKDDNAALKYYNPGLYVYTKPTEINDCTGISNFSKCANYGWKEYEPGDDEHYLVGNYYSFAAATVGTGNSLTADGQQASWSICPKNWKLPLSGGTNNGTRGSFYYLLNSYGYNFRVDNGNTITDLVSSTGQNIAAPPLYFLRGGSIGTTSLNYAGLDGNYWSRIVPSGTNAFFLYFNSADVNSSANYFRSRGHSIRCLVI